ncbi:hypothetical protein NKI51_30390 [Mesorhizobium australicum]|uniref:hypothetical protein n=1 Tax=Mesorhizobium australicum TaxID=536018 RepID=UPI003338ED56
MSSMGYVLALLSAACLEATASPYNTFPLWTVTDYHARSGVLPVSLRTPRSDLLWLVVSSRPTEGEAIALAQAYAPTLGPTVVAQSRNGLFAIIAGTLNIDKAKPNLKTLKGLHIIPQDSFLSRGDSLDRIVWMSFQRGDSLDFMMQPAYRQVVQRIQAAMTRLSLYSGPIDGLIGPSTVSSFSTYMANFGVPAGDLLTEYSLAEIERGAGDGFRNDQERNLAQSLGFTEASSYRAATAGGFPSASIFAQAKSLGFSTQREFDAAVSGGFRSRDEYQRAQAAGFTSADDFRAAQQFGIQSKTELVAFRASGFTDPVEFRNASQKGFADKASFDKSEARRLKASKAAANILLSDAQTFLKLNPQTSNLVEIADKAAALNAQVQTNSADALNDSTLRLTNLLMAVPGFAEFSASKDKERSEDIEKQKALISAEIQGNQQALKTWMATHLTSSKLPLVVSEVKALDGMTSSSDLEALTDARDSVRALIASQGLTGELAALKAPTQEEDKAEPQADNNPAFTVTELNKVLLKGALDDVAVLYNAGPAAPSLLKTISGEFSFTKNEAWICLFGVESTPALEKVLHVALEPLGGKTIHINRECGQADINQADVFFIQHKKFVEAKPSFAVAYLEAVEAKTLRPFDKINYPDLKRRMDQDRVLAIQIAADVEKGSKLGYGGILLDSKSTRICGVIDGEPKIHMATIDKLAEFASIPNADPQISNVDTAYQDVRRDKCRILYGSSATLKAVTEALTRDSVNFAYAPIWFEQSDFTAAQAKFELARRGQVQSEQAARVAAEEAKRVTAQRVEEAQKSKAAQEAVLRQKNGAAAAALLNMFSDGLKTAVLDETAKSQTPSGINISALFPDFARWNQQLGQDAWKATDASSSVDDYGTVNWKSRNLEAIIIKTVVKTASAERGEYKDECFVFGAVIDNEFKMVRDPYEARCEKDASSDWAVGHELKSLWVVN